MKIKVSDLTPRQLNYAVCAIEGKALQRAKPATHDEVAKRVFTGHFTMYGITHTFNKDREWWDVETVTVTGVGRPEAPMARCIRFISKGKPCLGDANDFFFTEEEARKEALVWTEGHYEDWHFDTDAGLAHPIIERERITLSYSGPDDSEPCAYYLRTLFEDQEGWYQKGPTPLIAAMRCYVASKLGDEVEIPEGV